MVSNDLLAVGIGGCDPARLLRPLMGNLGNATSGFELGRIEDVFGFLE
jgi:hypothetical protein